MTKKQIQPEAYILGRWSSKGWISHPPLVMGEGALEDSNQQLYKQNFFTFPFQS
jgi:hypothetical protein